MLTVPTLADLALFTGRPEAALGDFAPEALTQATLLFTVTTRLTAMPVDADMATLATYAILEMADRLLLEQPYQSVKAKPFQSESFGAYSYSRSTATAKTVLQGMRTGLLWWDTAVEQLQVLDTSLTAHGSIKVSHDGLVVDADGVVSVQEPGCVDDWPPYVRIS